MQASAQQLQAIRQEVYTDETIEWVGRPRPLRFARRGIGGSIYGMVSLALTVAWLAAATGWQQPDLGTWQGWLLVLAAVPILLAEILLLLSSLWMWRAALRTTYVVTNERAIILRTGWLGSTRSFLADRVRYMIVRPRPDGSGDILFQLQSCYGRDGRAHVMATGFLGIEDVAKVQRLLEAICDYREYSHPPVSRSERIGAWVPVLVMLIWTTIFTIPFLRTGRHMDLAILRTPAGRIDAVAHYTWTGKIGLGTETVEGVLKAQVAMVEGCDDALVEVLQLDTPAGPRMLSPYDGSPASMADNINQFIRNSKAPPLQFHQRAFGWPGHLFLCCTLLGTGLTLLFTQMAWNSGWAPANLTVTLESETQYED